MFAVYLNLLLLLLITTLVHQSVQDNTPDLDHWISKQDTISFQTIHQNINPHGTKRGFFAASLSTYRPDYFYTWTRDAALVARVLTSLNETSDDTLMDYIQFQIDTQSADTRCGCLGEPKFNTDGSSYRGTWGRPQNDGPAERAVTFMLIATRWIDNGYQDTAWIYNHLVPSLVKDLDYIVKVWYQDSFDLWEEVLGTHFYTLMVMRRAMLDSVGFFNSYEKRPVDEYRLTAHLIAKRLEGFWSVEHGYVMATQGIRNGVQKPSGLDVSTLLAANLVASRKDGFFSPGSDKILATVAALEKSFKSLYPINHQQAQNLGTCIGRYPEDIYDGYDTSVGNPWFLATAAFTELYYLAIEEWKQVGVEVNDINQVFFSNIMQIEHGYYAPQSNRLNQLIGAAQVAANRFLKTIRFHQANNGSMSEQYDRYIGYMAGARDLTWSHAAFISASRAKSERFIQ
ncbi:Six-hairpin glycosidase-like protein [Helicostylum pulchrum]|nr:Six-hairpin glycosidase-like protein [Helicostylum pulchrum]